MIFYVSSGTLNSVHSSLSPSLSSLLSLSLSLLFLSRRSSYVSRIRLSKVAGARGNRTALMNTEEEETLMMMMTPTPLSIGRLRGGS